MPVLDCPIPEKIWVQQVAQDGRFLKAEDSHSQKPAQDAGRWEPAVRKIVDFQHLGAGCDGIGAKPPSRELLESAIGLAYLFSERGVEPPNSVVPGVDGSINFEWQDPDGTFTHVEIDRPLHAEVMVIEPGKPAEQWELPNPMDENDAVDDRRSRTASRAT